MKIPHYPEGGKKPITYVDFKDGKIYESGPEPIVDRYGDNILVLTDEQKEKFKNDFSNSIKNMLADYYIFYDKNGNITYQATTHPKPKHIIRSRKFNSVFDIEDAQIVE